MTLGTKTCKRLLAVGAVAGLGALAAISPADARAPATRDCAPVRFEVDYRGAYVNAFSDLRATRNLSCSAAQAMQRYSITHELYLGFQWRRQHWGWTIYSRADGRTAATMWTARHRQQVWSTTRLAVS
jgi:hypothetical protein